MADYPPAPPVAPEENKAPTYTTVGSIYNAQAATPLQPPTRRSRAQRYTPAYQSTAGAVIIVGSVPSPSLSAFSTNEAAAIISPMSANNVQKYSPLQQNYDRAVSPVPDQATDMGINSPSVVDDAVHSQPPSTLPDDAFAILYPHSNPRDDEGDAAEAALKSRFSMQGIRNLASYPNPSQLTAKNVLTRARTANLNPADIPLPFAYDPSEAGRDAAIPPSPHHSTPLDPTSVNVPHHDTRGRFELGQTTRLPPTGPRARMERAAHQVWAGYKRANGAGTLSTGPGAPQPLTAGPPGHRQYRPSTFEAHFKALQGAKESAESRSQAILTKAKVSSLRDPASYLGRGVRGDNETPGQYHFSSFGDRYTSSVYSSIAQLESEPLVADSKLAQNMAGSTITNTLPPEAVKKYYPHGFPSESFTQYRPINSDWLEEYPIYRRTLQPLTVEEVARRQRKVDSAFYAGTGWLGKTMDDTIHELHERRSGAQVGVVAMGRGDATNPAEDNGGMVAYPPMTVEEANAQDDSEHIGPLLNMSFTTLLSYAEEYDKHPHKRGWRSGFVTPDKGLVVIAKDGNKSFFDDGN